MTDEQRAAAEVCRRVEELNRAVVQARLEDLVVDLSLTQAHLLTVVVSREVARAE